MLTNFESQIDIINRFLQQINADSINFNRSNEKSKISMGKNLDCIKVPHKTEIAHAVLNMIKKYKYCIKSITYPNSNSSGVSIIISSSMVNWHSVSISSYGKNLFDSLFSLVRITFNGLLITGHSEAEKEEISLTKKSYLFIVD